MRHQRPLLAVGDLVRLAGLHDKTRLRPRRRRRSPPDVGLLRFVAFSLRGLGCYLPRASSRRNRTRRPSSGTCHPRSPSAEIGAANARQRAAEKRLATRVAFRDASRPRPSGSRLAKTITRLGGTRPSIKLFIVRFFLGVLRPESSSVSLARPARSAREIGRRHETGPPQFPR